ncbi:hypothetical protein [Streptomyces johnsoniae]|uniref:Uncharacterized protein n=1 Tax=Streptomyces johnsoniae TaxID=3075532 RepID=A0ABU2S575_9ACTN|nr:hypothetical protein [Streptomyces sp. DSM 41886]MDT0442755.1 hypothetical protein [Streptomyces sp. DSM 41886]
MISSAAHRAAPGGNGIGRLSTMWLMPASIRPGTAVRVAAGSS